jgi:hypothetical protein
MWIRDASRLPLNEPRRSYQNNKRASSGNGRFTPYCLSLDSSDLILGQQWTQWMLRILLKQGRGILAVKKYAGRSPMRLIKMFFFKGYRKSKA